MTSIEKLEDILHREKLAKLQKEIDELPDLYNEYNNIFLDIGKECNSYDLIQPFVKSMNKT